MKQAAVGNILAVFQGWKCNGLNLSLDFVEADFVAQPLMADWIQLQSVCCLLEECSIATRISLVEDSIKLPSAVCILSFDLCIPTKLFHYCIKHPFLGVSSLS